MIKKDEKFSIFWQNKHKIKLSYSCRKFILPKQQKNILSNSGEENVI